MSETYIPLSQINTYVFCPRRFYYESVEGHQVINEHVEEGKIKHTRVDTEMKDRKERGVKVSRRQYLASDTLGVSGYLDLIEEKKGYLVLSNTRKRAPATGSTIRFNFACKGC